MQGLAEQLVKAGLPGPPPGQVQQLLMGRVRDPGRGVDQLGAHGRNPGPGVPAAGEDGGGAGEVERDHRAGQPGGVRSEHPRREVGERPVLQLGDDLLDEGVVAVGGLRGQHRLARVGEHGVVANTAW